MNPGSIYRSDKWLCNDSQGSLLDEKQRERLTENFENDILNKKEQRGYLPFCFAAIFKDLPIANVTRELIVCT